MFRKINMSSPIIRAKFNVESVLKTRWGSEETKLTAVIGTNDDNKAWCKSTPCGNLSITIDNPQAQGKLIPGKEYYIDFIPAEEPAPATKQGPPWRMTNSTALRDAATIACIAFLLAGCTISPNPAKPRQIASYSGNSLNSGILAEQYGPQHQFQGFVVNADFVARFNQYAKDYGIYLIPQPQPLPAGTTLITAQQMVTFKDLEAQPGLGKKKQTLLNKIGI
jgi:hypothetical protein